ncbi:MAG: hypothetical protein DRG59_02355 [Deltaproteobacteria bacterium]|nr:MAG: hypothetical protein DRG59_02355 [Deltaproteobacteria bacterium]
MDRQAPKRWVEMKNSNRANMCVPLLIPRSYKTSEENKTGSWRFLRPRYLEKTAPCSSACPVGQDIPRIQMLAVQGSFKEAWELLLSENPFPGTCGRVCFHPCESACNRLEFDEAVAIRMIERFLADTASRYELQPRLNKLAEKGKKVAIIGSGPGGLSAAYFLALLGYSCDVFESSNKPGGMLRWAIPFYRLPLKVLEEEIARIESLGVRIFCNHHVEFEKFKHLRSNYDAIFVSCGYQKGRRLNIPGEESPGVEDGLTFLRELKSDPSSPSLHGSVAVIGGGNTAIDVARSVLRCGAKPVIVYRRRKEDMRAFGEEIKMALDEGVRIEELKSPLKIEKKESGVILTLQKMKVAGIDESGRAAIEPDNTDPEIVSYDRVFVAIGTEPSEPWYVCDSCSGKDIKLYNSVMRFDGQFPVIFGGDLTTEAKTVTNAIASGKEAAMALDVLFRIGKDFVLPEISRCRVGNGLSVSMEIYLNGERKNRVSHVVSYAEINTDYFNLIPRTPQPRLLREERINSFSEIDLKISGSVAMKEAGRCFNCGICNHCDNCYLFCPEIAVKRQDSEEGGLRAINYDYCKGCGLCVVECPRNAMVLEEESA